MNSYLTGQDLANELRMARRNGKLRALLIIEGRSDHKFYANYVDRENCEIYGREGKKQVTECIEILNADASIEGYLGIVDLDYDSITNISSVMPNLIYVEEGDLERMLFTPKVVRKILSEMREECLTSDTEDEIVDQVLHEAARIGKYRYTSHHCEVRLRPNPHRMKFRGIDIGAMQRSQDDIVLDDEKIFREIERVSRKSLDFEAAMAAVNIDEAHISNIITRKLSQGHDIMDIFLRGLQFKWGRRFINLAAIESTARMCFEWVDFEESSVFTGIQEWERTHAPYVILRRAT